MQGNRSGGQAIRMCTSRAPLTRSFSLTILRIWVPRTIESSQRTMRLSRMISGIAINFMLAIRSRVVCTEGM